MAEITPEQERLADDAARAIVDTARALHPGDPVKQAACAINAALHLQAIWPGTQASAENMDAATLERKLAGERIPYGNGRQ